MVDVFVKMFQSTRKDIRIDCLFIDTQQVMKYLIDQSHCVEMSGPDSLFRMMPKIATSIHFLGKNANGAKVGKDNVAGNAVQRIIKFIFFPDFGPNMKFISRIILEIPRR